MQKIAEFFKNLGKKQDSGMHVEEPSDSVQLPPSYFQYKGTFRKCAAIQIIFEYFPLKELIKMQQLSRRFYGYVCPGICPKVPLPEKVGYTEQMKKQVTKVMIFSKQGSFYTISQQTGFRWKETPLVVVDPLLDFERCPTEWPKNC